MNKFALILCGLCLLVGGLLLVPKAGANELNKVNLLLTISMDSAGKLKEQRITFERICADISAYAKENLQGEHSLNLHCKKAWGVSQEERAYPFSNLIIGIKEGNSYNQKVVEPYIYI